MPAGFAGLSEKALFLRKIFPTRGAIMKLDRVSAVLACVLAVSGCASIQSYKIDTHVPSTPDTVVWGYLPAGRAPVATIRSGQVVRIDTVSHQGLLSGMDPVQF